MQVAAAPRELDERPPLERAVAAAKTHPESGRMLTTPRDADRGPGRLGEAAATT